MSTQAEVSQEILARGGLRLPTAEFVDDGSILPVHFLDFFRETFRLNLPSTSSWLPSKNNPKLPATEQVVIPSSAEKPAVVLDYRFTPSAGRYSGADELLRVLVPPTEVDEFQLFMGIDYHFRDPGTAGNRGYLKLTHEGTTTKLRLLDFPEDEFYQYSEREVAQFTLLGSATNNFVDLVS